MQNWFVAMLPIRVICPECMEAFEADPRALEYGQSHLAGAHHSGKGERSFPHQGARRSFCPT